MFTDGVCVSNIKTFASVAKMAVMDFCAFETFNIVSVKVLFSQTE